MSAHAQHFIPGPDGGPIATPVGGCAECAALVGPVRDHASAEQARRDDLARDVAREWALNGPSDDIDQRDRLWVALDRLAAAYLPNDPQDTPG